MCGSDRCNSSTCPIGTPKGRRDGWSWTPSPDAATARLSPRESLRLPCKIRRSARPAVPLDQPRIGPALTAAPLVATEEGGGGVVTAPSYGIAPVLKAIDAKH